MATQVTSKLPIVDDIPSVTKLWNGRYRLEFFCKPSDKKIGWYKENIDKWLPAFGALQDDALENGWEYPANQDVSYDDMRLVEASVPYVPSAGEHFIRLVYETLTSSFVAEVDDKVIEGDNGLQITERKLIAKAGVEFTEEVGTGAYDGKTLIQSEVENTDAYTRVTARYSESGVISRSTDLVGSQQALVITSLGETPATPSGYSLAKTDVNNEEGFETTSYTFYENDSILSRSNDYVGSQLAEAIEVFNPSVEPTPTNAGAVLGNKSESNVDGIPTTRYTFLVPSVLSESEDKVGSQKAITIEAFNEIPVTPTGYVIANEQDSDVEGIPTKRYTFLKPSVLSRSEDKVGSQLAIVIEAFDEIPSTPAGYDLANKQESDVEGIPTKRYTFLKPSVLSRTEDKVGSQKAIVVEAFGEIPSNPGGYRLANTQESDFEGIPTKRYTFLKPSILSVQQDFNNGLKRVSVRAFDMTESEVSRELSAVTYSHELVSSAESDYEGLKTSTFTYDIDDFEVTQVGESGFKTIERTELSVSNFSDQVVGTTEYKSSYYLTYEDIDNGGEIKVRRTKWSERGVISILPIEGEEFSLAKNYTYVTYGIPASSMEGLTDPIGDVLPANISWLEPSVQNVDGFPVYTQDVIFKNIPDDEAVKVDSYDKFFTVTDPGTMTTGGAFNSAAKSGGAVRWPEATTQPRTYRKKATVDVYITRSSTISETEVAYNESATDWCSIAFTNFYNNEKDSSSSVDGNWRSFPQYLNSAGTTATADATSAGEYYAEANSYGAGSTTYLTTGTYRVELDKYKRDSDGYQLYIKTIITFS